MAVGGKQANYLVQFTLVLCIAMAKENITVNSIARVTLVFLALMIKPSGVWFL